MAQVSELATSYALILEAATDGLWDWDIPSGKVYRSARLQEILGLDTTARWASPLEWMEFIHPEDRGRYQGNFRAYLKKDVERFECRYRLRDAHGGYRWVFDRATGLRDAGGRVYRVAGWARNITEEVAREAFFHGAIDTISEGFVVYDKDDRFVICNQAYRDRYPASASHMVAGATFEDVLRAGLARGEYVDAIGTEDTWLAERLRRHREASGAVEQRLRDGRHILITERRMSDGGIAGLRMDITAMKQAEAARNESERRLESVAANLPGVLFQRWLKPDGAASVSYFGDAVDAVLGKPAQGIVHDLRTLVSHLHPDDARKYRAAIRRSAAKLSPMHVQLRVLTARGEVRWFESRSRPQRLEDGTVEWNGLAFDVTERKTAEAERDRLAYLDHLTNLPNRNLFMDRLNQALTQAERTGGGSGAVLVMDIDRFHEIFDSWGAATSDALLIEVASRLRKALRATDTIARIGDNQFGVLSLDVERRNDAIGPVTRLMRLFETPFQLGDNDLHARASVGIALFPADGRDVSTLLQNAETALHRAKADGKSRYQFYVQALSEGALRRASIETELHRAVAANELEVFYQPKIRPSGEIAGAEALVRWRHREHGLVMPGTFIPIAEQSELIGSIGEFVLRAAAEQNRAWQRQGLRAVPISVNLSKVQLRDPRLARRISGILAAADLAPEYLELELTESAILRDVDLASALIRQVRELGVRVAIDDFGVQYSALNHLADLPVDALKVDYSFVSKIATAKRYAAIVEAIISMAHTLGYKAIAEGVETAPQADLLRAFGCDELQGFLYSPPVEAAAFERILAAGCLSARSDVRRAKT